MIKKVEGLLIVECKYSNINGDPDNEGNPRLTLDDRGLVSDVSIKAKMRDMLLNDTIWEELSPQFDPPLDRSRFDILEQANRCKMSDLVKEIKDKGIDTFHNSFWDARMFGNTVLEENKKDKKDDEEKEDKIFRKHIRTGVVQFSLGRSVAPVNIINGTCTKKAAIQDDKASGMAPNRIKVVEHGIYCIPFFINPALAARTLCSVEDVEVFYKLLPEVYTHCASTTRTECKVIHAYGVEFKTLLGVGNLQISESLMPVKTENPDKPSLNANEYVFPGLDNDYLLSIDNHIHRKFDLCA